MEMTTGVGSVQSLLAASWDFADVSRGDRLTHQFHPYPAKFIPEIPATVLKALARPGDCVLDPFSGSGTTVVEAVAHGCHAIGVDVNPLAALLSRVKAQARPPELDAVDRLVHRAAGIAARWYSTGTFDRTFVEAANVLAGPRFSGIDFWFSPDAQLELSAIRSAIEEESGLFHDQALAACSAIVVRASRQDSDTRYVRREKSFRKLAAIEWFRSRLLELRRGLADLANDAGGSVRVFNADARSIASLSLPEVDLVITSSPYPNAFSYHLYHQLRCLWLGFPVDGLRQSEIGNHRDYSRRNGHDAATFVVDMTHVLRGVRRHCHNRAKLVFVIGDSIIRGDHVDNVALLRQAAEQSSIHWLGSVQRVIRSGSKSFNPDIGRIKTESICLMELA